MITIQITLAARTAQEAIAMYQEMQAAGITASVNTTQANKRFRMTREQKQAFNALPESEQEAFRADLMKAAGFLTSEQEESAQSFEDINPEECV